MSSATHLLCPKHVETRRVLEKRIIISQMLKLYYANSLVTAKNSWPLLVLYARSIAVSVDNMVDTIVPVHPNPAQSCLFHYSCSRVRRLWQWRHPRSRVFSRDLAQVQNDVFSALRSGRRAELYEVKTVCIVLLRLHNADVKLKCYDISSKQCLELAHISLTVSYRPPFHDALAKICITLRTPATYAQTAEWIQAT